MYKEELQTNRIKRNYKQIKSDTKVLNWWQQNNGRQKNT